MSTEDRTPDTNDQTEQPEAPEAEGTSTELSPEDMRREMEKARKEAAKYRTRLREKEEAEKTAQEAKRQAEMTAEERAKEAERRAETALAEAEARVQKAERRAALAGKVSNPDRVLRLMDDPESYFDGTEPNLDAILSDFAEYAPSKRQSAPAPEGTPGPSGRRYTSDDLKNMTEAEINANWSAISADLKKAP